MIRTFHPRFFILLSLWLGACVSVPEVKPYRIDIRQGNVVTQEMVAQLKPGLTKDQVKFILGSPLVLDMFHTDRWDYVYYFQPGKGAAQERRLTVLFAEGKLSKLSGDVVAGEGWLEGGAQPNTTVREIDIPAEPKKKGGLLPDGLFGKSK